MFLLSLPSRLFTHTKAIKLMFTYSCLLEIISFLSTRTTLSLFGISRLKVGLLFLLCLNFVSFSRMTVCVICSVNLTADTYLQISYDKASFEVSALMHPSTYLNKILFGSSQGSLQLWNIKSKYALLMTAECSG